MTTMCVFLVLLFSPPLSLFILIETAVIQITCDTGHYCAPRRYFTSRNITPLLIDLLAVAKNEMNEILQRNRKL